MSEAAAAAAATRMFQGLKAAGQEGSSPTPTTKSVCEPKYETHKKGKGKSDSNIRTCSGRVTYDSSVSSKPGSSGLFLFNSTVKPL